MKKKVKVKQFPLTDWFTGINQATNECLNLKKKKWMWHKKNSCDRLVYWDMDPKIPQTLPKDGGTVLLQHCVECFRSCYLNQWFCKFSEFYHDKHKNCWDGIHPNKQENEYKYLSKIWKQNRLLLLKDTSVL